MYLNAEPPYIVFTKLSNEKTALRVAPNGHLVIDLCAGFRQQLQQQVSNSSSSTAPTLENPKTSNKPKGDIDLGKSSYPFSSPKQPRLSKPLPAYPAEIRPSEAVAVIRKLARDTRGPWVTRSRFDVIESMLSGLIGASSVRILAVNIAYKPRITRTLPQDFAKHCTHWIMLGLDNNGEMTLLPRKQWTSYMNNVCKELSVRFSLLVTVFSRIEASVDPNNQWRPTRKAGSAHVSFVEPSLTPAQIEIESGSEPLSPPPGLEFRSDARCQGEVSEPGLNAARASTLRPECSESRRKQVCKLVGLQGLQPQDCGHQEEHGGAELLCSSALQPQPLFRSPAACSDDFAGTRRSGFKQSSTTLSQGCREDPVPGPYCQRTAFLHNRGGAGLGKGTADPEGKVRGICRKDCCPQAAAASFSSHGSFEQHCYAAEENPGAGRAGHGVCGRSGPGPDAPNRGNGAGNGLDENGAGREALPAAAEALPQVNVVEKETGLDDLSSGSDCWVSADVLQKQTFQGHLTTAPREPPPPVEPC